MVHSIHRLMVAQFSSPEYAASFRSVWAKSRKYLGSQPLQNQLVIATGSEQT
jgi:hypothetical protein